jgi:hypothetical protein
MVKNKKYNKSKKSKSGKILAISLAVLTALGAGGYAGYKLIPVVANVYNDTVMGIRNTWESITEWIYIDRIVEVEVIDTEAIAAALLAQTEAEEERDAALVAQAAAEASYSAALASLNSANISVDSAEAERDAALLAQSEAEANYNSAVIALNSVNLSLDATEAERDAALLAQATAEADYNAAVITLNSANADLAMAQQDLDAALLAQATAEAERDAALASLNDANYFRDLASSERDAVIADRDLLLQAYYQVVAERDAALAAQAAAEQALYEYLNPQEVIELTYDMSMFYDSENHTYSYAWLGNKEYVIDEAGLTPYDVRSFYADAIANFSWWMLPDAYSPDGSVWAAGGVERLNIDLPFAVGPEGIDIYSVELILSNAEDMIFFWTPYILGDISPESWMQGVVPATLVYNFNVANQEVTINVNLNIDINLLNQLLVTTI